jgi:hypothetical protein
LVAGLLGGDTSTVESNILGDAHRLRFIGVSVGLVFLGERCTRSFADAGS